MKKSILITTGILIVTLLVAIWVYLLFYGTPRSTNEVFTNLGITGTASDSPFVMEEDFTDSEPVVQIAAPTSALQQLTTRPIAGMYARNSSTTAQVWYMERGTGYIYQIDLNTRVETQISQATIPQVTKALFSPNGTAFVYQKEAITTEPTLALIDTSTDQLTIQEFITLPPTATNLAFESDTALLYTVTSEIGTTGYRFDALSKIREEVFIIPLRQVRVNWGNGNNSIVVYTKADHRLPGFAYEVINNKLIPYHSNGNGLVVHNTDSFSLHTLVPSNGPRPQSSFFIEDKQYTIPQLLIPEKCVTRYDDADRVWCASPSGAINNSFITDWYKGTVTSNDHLWVFSIRAEFAELKAAFDIDTGRQIDAVDLFITPNQRHLFFKNRIDNTLWLYDLTF